MTEQHVASGMPQDEEPQTPMWLPAVGAALFVGVALWWAVTPPVAPAAPAEPAASASAPAAAAAAPNPQAQAVVPAQPGAGAPSARIPMPSPSALPPDVQKRLNELRGKKHP